MPRAVPGGGRETAGMLIANQHAEAPPAKRPRDGQRRPLAAVGDEDCVSAAGHDWHLSDAVDFAEPTFRSLTVSRLPRAEALAGSCRQQADAASYVEARVNGHGVDIAVCAAHVRRRAAPSTTAGRSAGAGESTRRRAARAAGHARSSRAHRAVLMPSETRLIGAQIIRPFHPPARRRARNARRVASAGSIRCATGGACSKCVTHHAIASAHCSDVADRNRQARAAQTEVPAAEERPSHQARQRRVVEINERSGPDDPCGNAELRGFALDQFLLHALAPGIRTEATRIREAAACPRPGAPTACAAVAARTGCSRARGAGRRPRASRAAGAAWRRWCCADGPRSRPTSPPRHAPRHRRRRAPRAPGPRSESATTHSRRLRRVRPSVASDAAHVGERPRDLGAEKPARAGHDRHTWSAIGPRGDRACVTHDPRRHRSARPAAGRSG